MSDSKTKAESLLPTVGTFDRIRDWKVKSSLDELGLSSTDAEHYGTQTWAMKTSDELMLGTFERKFCEGIMKVFVEATESTVDDWTTICLQNTTHSHSSAKRIIKEAGLAAAGAWTKTLSRCKCSIHTVPIGISKGMRWNIQLEKNLDSFGVSFFAKWLRGKHIP